jgi:hypothetical protein
MTETANLSYQEVREILAIIADHFGVDLTDVKFGMGICANVFNAKEERHDDTGRVS